MRRAMRILPAYYAALVFSIGLYGLMHWPLTPGLIVSHALLIHNVSAGWARNLDAPLWSVATEWQIYFLLPMFFIPLWHRWGMGAAVAAGLVLGIVPLLVLSPAGNFNWACPQYIGLFGMGLAAATVPRNSRFPWGAVGTLGAAAFCVLVILGTITKDKWMPRGLHITEAWPLDILAGGVTTCVILSSFFIAFGLKVLLSLKKAHLTKRRLFPVCFLLGSLWPSADSPTVSIWYIIHSSGFLPYPCRSKSIHP